MKKLIIFFSFFAILLQADASLYSWELYDRIIAIVNSVPIIESEVMNKLNVLRKNTPLAEYRVPYEKSRILDTFIENAIVLETATNESIVVSDASVYSHIEKLLRQFFAPRVKNREELEAFVPQLVKRLESRINAETISENKALDPQLQDFIKFVEDNQKQSFEDYFYDTKNQIRKEQVMSIAIGVSPPTRKEAEEWYRNNLEKIGYEVNIRHIMIRPRAPSLTEERNVFNVLAELRNRVAAGESFENLAMQYSQDPGSAKRGGDLGWVMLQELDPYFAGNVHTMARVGQISQVFKSGMGYHIVKFLGKRPVQYEKVENMIMYKLYGEAMEAQFKKWMEKKRNTAAIKIYMADYVKQM